MTWHPVDKKYTTENFQDSNTGSYIYTDFFKQNNIGGGVSLRNIATGSNLIIPAGEPWSPMIWSDTNDFSIDWRNISGNFISLGIISGNTSNGTAVLNNAVIYDLSDYSFSQGVLFESSVYIKNLTGNPSGFNSLYGYFIQDGSVGVDMIALQSDPPGFLVGYSLPHETFISCPDLKERLVSFRYGVKNGAGQFLIDNGESTILTGIVVSPPLVPGIDVVGVGGISLVSPASTSDTGAIIEVGKLNIKKGVSDIYGDFINDVEYSTSSVTMTTPVFFPTKKIRKMGSMFVNLNGHSGGGTTQVYCIYTNGIEFGLFGVPVISATTGLYEVDLSNIPVTSDIRTFLFGAIIIQFSADGSRPPPTVDYITFTFDTEDNNEFAKFQPSQGSWEGDYLVNVSLSIHPGDYKKPIIPGPLDISVLKFDRLSGNIYNLKDPTVVTNINSTGSILTGFFGEASAAYGLITESPVVTGICRSYFKSLGSVPQKDVDYKTIQIGNSELLASDSFQQLFATGSFTGSATGINGTYLNPFSYSSSFNDRVGTLSVGYSEIDDYYSMSQKYQGQAGQGFMITGLPTGTTGTHLLIEVDTQVQRGGLAISVSGNHNFSNDVTFIDQSYYNNKKARALIRKPTSSPYALSFYGVDSLGTLTGDCSFEVSNLLVKDFTDKNIRVAGDDSLISIWNQTIDIWFKPLAITYYTGTYRSIKDDYFLGVESRDIVEILLGFPDAIGNFITLDQKGYPLLTVDDNINKIYVTGSFPANLDEWNHLALTKNVNSVEMYLNGELCAKLDTAAGAWLNLTSVVVGKNFYGSVGSFRHTNAIRNPDYISSLQAFRSPLKFETDRSLPRSGAAFLYRFDDGTLRDYGPYSNHLITPAINFNRNSVNKAEGIFGDAKEYYGRGYSLSYKDFGILNTGVKTGDLSFYLMSIPNDIGTTSVFKTDNISFSLISGRYPLYSYQAYSGAVPLELTGSEDISQFYNMGWIHVRHEFNTGNTVIVGKWSADSSSTGDTIFSGSLNYNSGMYLTGSLRVGHDTGEGDFSTIYIEELGFHTGIQIGPSLLYYDKQIAMSDHKVYINGVASSETRNYGVYDKSFIMPPQSSFNKIGATPVISVDTPAGRIELASEFKYIGKRSIVLDTGSLQALSESSDKICKTKSVFRIGTQVPEDAVNLGFISGPAFSSETSLSLISNAGSIGPNIVNSLSEYQAISAEAVEGNEFTLLNSLDTDEVLITNISNTRRDLGIDSPMFYGYLIGQKEYYLYSNDPLMTTGLVLPSTLTFIRNSIKLKDQEGSDIDPEIFPWDIRASKKDVDGNPLPANVFSVQVLSRDKYIPNRTIIIEYNASDPKNGYREIKGYREILNSNPLFCHSITTNSLDSFSTNLNNGNGIISTSRKNAGSDLSVKMNTGFWSPEISKNTFKSDEFIV